jgi:hypothetical protein
MSTVSGMKKYMADLASAGHIANRIGNINTPPKHTNNKISIFKN